MKTFTEQLEARWEKGYFLCVGLDPVLEKLPTHFAKSPDSILAFNREIIDATAAIVCAFKPNSAFYEAFGAEGIAVLAQTISYIKDHHPELPVILDAKRGDIESTNLGYTQSTFDLLGADAITIHPYLGKTAIQPFLDYKDKGIIILVRTSNPGAGEFQDLKLDGKPLYQHVAQKIASEWNTNDNCAVVVGATYPEELKIVREIIGDMPILIPGIGTQGGDIEKTVKAGQDSRGWGMIISASRSIIYASNGEDFAQKARGEAEKMHKQIQEALKK
jgi:orotidine-5'-phosphate decarboxylase